MKKKRKLNIKKLILFILMIIFTIMIAFSMIKIIKYVINNSQNRHIKKITSESVNIIPGKLEDKYEVDFKELKKQNSDTVAYLKVNGTNIDYIVVKGNDNKYYLDHNFNKKSNVSGWIFADYRNNFNGTDKNIIIYGHNTWDGSMFGTLKNIFNEDWYKDEDNLKIMLITDEGINYYQVFSVYTVTAEDYYINTFFMDDDEYNDFLGSIKFRTLVDFNVDLKDTKNILTLSTCTGDGKKRVVLHAKLISK